MRSKRAVLARSGASDERGRALLMAAERSEGTAGIARRGLQDGSARSMSVRNQRKADGCRKRVADQATPFLSDFFHRI